MTELTPVQPWIPNQIPAFIALGTVTLMWPIAMGLIKFIDWLYDKRLDRELEHD